MSILTQKREEREKKKRKKRRVKRERPGLFVWLFERERKKKQRERERERERERGRWERKRKNYYLILQHATVPFYQWNGTIACYPKKLDFGTSGEESFLVFGVPNVKYFAFFSIWHT